MMNGKIILGGVVVLLCLIGGIFFWQKISEPTQLPAQPTKELKLSDFPEAFKEKTVIVLGDNASEIERQAAEEIKNFLVEHNSSYIKIIDSQKIGSFKKGYNLVIIGTPKTNPLLEEVYAMTNATRVTEEFPSEGKGVLEILPNPWDESKAMLLVEGWDASSLLLLKCAIMIGINTVHEKSKIIDIKMLENYFNSKKIDQNLKGILFKLCLSDLENWNKNISVIVYFERELSEGEVKRLESEYELKFDRLPDGTLVKIGKSYNIHIRASRLIEFTAEPSVKYIESGEEIVGRVGGINNEN